MASAILCVDLRLVGQPGYYPVAAVLLGLAGVSGKIPARAEAVVMTLRRVFTRRRCVRGICSGIEPMQAGVQKGFRSTLT
jgi:transcriptional regulator GlxA family with amidase domain